MNSKPSPSVTTSHRTQRIARSVAIAGIAMLSITACSSDASNKPTTAESNPASPSTSIATTATDRDTNQPSVRFSEWGVYLSPDSGRMGQ